MPTDSTALDPARNALPVDHISGKPVEDWRTERGAAFVRTKRGRRATLRNEEWRGHLVTPVEVRAELVVAQGALEPRLRDGLLIAVLLDRKLSLEKISTRLRWRAMDEGRLYVELSDAEMLERADEAKKAIEKHLTTAFGFLPKFQIRWVGSIENSSPTSVERNG